MLHLCAEANESGIEGPSLDDVITLIKEDIANTNNNFSAVHSRSRRALRATRATKTSPKSHGCAPRTRHLRYNYFGRPRRHLQEDIGSEVLDFFSVVGGYDGAQIFFEVVMDVSKQAVDDLDSLILQPLQTSNIADLLNTLNLYNGNSSELLFDMDAEISFSSSAHLGVTG